MTQDSSDLWVMEEASAILFNRLHQGTTVKMLSLPLNLPGTLEQELQLDGEEALEDIHFTTHTDRAALIKYVTCSSAGG